MNGAAQVPMFKSRRRWSRSVTGKKGRGDRAGVPEADAPPGPSGRAPRGRWVGRCVRFLYRARPLRFLSAPMLWFCILPIGFMHLTALAFQFVCFPVFGIPFVRARDYIAMDRHRLGYLGPVAKLNCDYCGYVNGVLAYAAEIAGRTEQYWCPIKHALRLKAVHRRYGRFLDYGDPEQFRRRFERVRHDFADVERSGEAGGK